VDSAFLEGLELFCVGGREGGPVDPTYDESRKGEDL
jgi:hypothetical protein